MGNPQQYHQYNLFSLSIWYKVHPSPKQPELCCTALSVSDGTTPKFNFRENRSPVTLLRFYRFAEVVGDTLTSPPKSCGSRQYLEIG
ncbi:hypothetical protein OUZ56_015089 [Daphnia magna]|uniref:Uncharacterized protein n=1 Tax=Daphnia magna TaxID=35525 RepID=A0ABR0ALS2_9CRUS|nr:hypothetical protein OUZ56_015089 [Daphnia magna]